MDFFNHHPHPAFRNLSSCHSHFPSTDTSLESPNFNPHLPLPSRLTTLVSPLHCLAFLPSLPVPPTPLQPLGTSPSFSAACILTVTPTLGLLTLIFLVFLLPFRLALPHLLCGFSFLCPSWKLTSPRLWFFGPLLFFMLHKPLRLSLSMPLHSTTTSTPGTFKILSLAQTSLFF